MEYILSRWRSWILAAILMFSIYVYFFNTKQTYSGSIVLSSFEPVRLQSNYSKHQYFTILFYNVPEWLTTMIRTMDFSKCKYSNCKIVGDREFLTRSHTVIFSGPGLPNIPPKKSKDQIWVFFSLESPYHISPHYKKLYWRYSFNWTMTYRKDSDIWYPYNRLENYTRRDNFNYSEIVRMKRKPIAWIVSNCNTPSKRELYVKRLQQYINVDKYGRCGSLKCSSSIALKCYQQLSKTYKFYLSFENSLCTGYFTEKIYNTFHPSVNMVPIVRGGTGMEEYFPKGIYISTSDFSDPKQLAEYIKGLTDDKFIDILKRKNKFVLPPDNEPYVFHSSLCDLCKKINSASRDKSYSKYIDIKKWLWNGMCKDPHDI